MNRIRRMAAWAAAALLLVTPGIRAVAEVTADKTESRGRVTEINWRDENGNLAAGPEGYATVKYEYGYNKTTETYYDAEGFPYETAGGYYGRIVSLDSFLVVTEYIGINGKPVNTRMGYARVERRTFMFGPERFTIFYDAGGRVVTVPSLGYAQVETTASGKTLTGRIFKDEKGNKVDSVFGYAAMLKKMNRNRNIIRVWYEHADESAATGPDGWSRCEIRRDPDNDARINAIEFYDIAGNLTDAGGYAREEYLYKGNAVIKTRYSSTGARVSPGGDAASVQQVIRDELVTEEMYLNEAGEPTTLPEGYAGATYAYDGNDRLILVQYVNADGEKTTCGRGYSAVQQTWDADGRLISRRYVDTEGAAVNNDDGVCEERYEYDEEGRMTGTKKYDNTGNAVR